MLERHFRTFIDIYFRKHISLFAGTRKERMPKWLYASNCIKLNFLFYRLKLVSKSFTLETIVNEKIAGKKLTIFDAKQLI